MTEQPLTLGTAILQLIELYREDHLEYYKVVVTICAIFGCDPGRVLNATQHRRLEEVKETVPTGSIHPFHKKEKKHVAAKDEAA